MKSPTSHTPEAGAANMPAFETIPVTELTAEMDLERSARCSVSKALEVVGTRSALLLIREAFLGTRRFDDFARRVGVTEAVASARLRELVDAGLLEKRPYQEPGQRTRSEYRLTQMGRDLYPVITALRQWGDKYLADDMPALDVTHRECGAPVHAEVRCEKGHLVPLGESAASVQRLT